MQSNTKQHLVIQLFRGLWQGIISSRVLQGKVSHLDDLIQPSSLEKYLFTCKWIELLIIFFITTEASYHLKNMQLFHCFAVISLFWCFL